MSYSKISFVVPSDKIGLVAQLVAGEVGEFTVTPVPDAVVLQTQSVRTGSKRPRKGPNPEGKVSLTRIGKIVLHELHTRDSGSPGKGGAELESALVESGFEPQSSSGCLSRLFAEGFVEF